MDERLLDFDKRIFLFEGAKVFFSSPSSCVPDNQLALFLGSLDEIGMIFFTERFFGRLAGKRSHDSERSRENEIENCACDQPLHISFLQRMF